MLIVRYTHKNKIVTTEIMHSLKQSISIPGCQTVGILFFVFIRKKSKDNATQQVFISIFIVTYEALKALDIRPNTIWLLSKNIVELPGMK